MISVDEILGPHQIVYDVYFSQVDSTGSGIIGAFEVNNFLKHSKLKDDILKEIWDLSDPNGKGYLDRQAFYICLKLVSLAQSGQPAKLENLNLASPAPKLGELSSNITSLVSPDDPWYIKASNRISYDRTFDSLSPINNKITGARVKPFLINSNLPVDVLGKIWELSDLDQDGQLDRDEFLIALQLINKAKEGTHIPDQLPPSLLPFKIRHSSISSVPLVGGAITSSVFPAIVNEIKPWIVTFEEKSKSDLLFTQIDTDKDGLVSGAECKDVFLKTGLTSTILANIWALCDMGSTGRLNCEQFALAMHFVNKKLATGLDPPMELLPEMIPPSLRQKPIVTEEAHASKEFEELQCQVTELHREKLFYEQRAAENEMQTRARRTELTHLELEMESVFKTLQEREMKKSEEHKKLSDCEERLVKVNAQLVDLRAKFDAEKSDVDKLRMQIQNVDMALRNKDTELGKMKTLLQAASNEQAGLDARLVSRKQHLNELLADLDSCNLELTLAKSRNEHLKALQTNLTQLIKLYDDSKPKGGNLTDEIKKLEAENERLLEEIKTNKAQQEHQQSSFNNNNGTSFANSFSDTSMSILPDPFQAVDPFSSTTSAEVDPFQSATSKANDDSVAATTAAVDAFDPFGTATTAAAFDPFGEAKSNGQSHDFDSSFPDIKKNGKKKEGPVRPAPPRPQTPNVSNKKSEDQSKTSQSQPRPQSAFPKMDFFSSNPNESSLNAFDPFGQQTWSSTDTSKQAKTTSAANFANFSEFDPFA